MKKTTPLGLITLFIAIPGVLYCGGSDSNPGGTAGSGPATGAGGHPSTGSSTTTFATGGGGPATTSGGGDNTTSGPGGSAGAGGATSGPGTGGRGGAGVGGAATGGAAGMGGANAGGRGGAPVDAGTCPAMQPANGTACTSLMEVCDYPGFACTCAPGGMTRDGGMRDAWNCVRVRMDAGVGMCPANPPMNRSMCPTVGEVCPYAMETCTCATVMGVDRWACVRPDAGQGD
jgi:hypothetical protein